MHATIPAMRATIWKRCASGYSLARRIWADQALFFATLVIMSGVLTLAGQWWAVAMPWYLTIPRAARTQARRARHSRSVAR